MGFVIDDAIVVLENIVRHQEKGLTPMQAGPDGVQGDQLYCSIDDSFFGGCVHPDVVHERCHRQTVS